MVAWAGDILKGLGEVCELLDRSETEPVYRASLDEQQAVVEDAGLTPSARILKEMRDNGESFYQFAMRMSETHKSYFLELDCTASDGYKRLGQEAAASLERQEEIEAQDSTSFDDYLSRYFIQ